MRVLRAGAKRARNLRRCARLRDDAAGRDTLFHPCRRWHRASRNDRSLRRRRNGSSPARDRAAWRPPRSGPLAASAFRTIAPARSRPCPGRTGRCKRSACRARRRSRGTGCPHPPASRFPRPAASMASRSNGCNGSKAGIGRRQLEPAQLPEAERGIGGIGRARLRRSEPHPAPGRSGDPGVVIERAVDDPPAGQARPGMSSRRASALALLRQSPVSPGLHWAMAGSKSQPRQSLIIPSARPSRASQRLSSARFDSPSSPSVKALASSGCPAASRGAMRASTPRFHTSSIAMREKRMVGCPATMPSNWVGRRCAAVNA